MKREPKDKQCRYCKGTFKQFRSTQVVCSTDCAIKLAEVNRKRKEEREWKKRKSQMKEELETVQSLMTKAQVHFNAYIRERDRGKQCISCPTILKGKFDAGHYHNANNHWSVRYSEVNVWGQCVRCNRDLHGNLINYRVGLVQRIGEEELAKLDAIANETRKYDRFELKAIIEKYKSKKNQKNFSL